MHVMTTPLANGAPAEPSEPRTPDNNVRRLVGLPGPTYRLLERLAVTRGLSMSDTLYFALRDELHRQEEGDAWDYCPPDFSIKATVFDDGMQVLFWNAWLSGVVLTGEEACRLAEGLHQAVEGTLPADFSVTGKRGEETRTVTLSRGPAHVTIHCGGLKYTMVRPVAIDVAAALDSASVGSGPLPTHEALAA